MPDVYYSHSWPFSSSVTTDWFKCMYQCLKVGLMTQLSWWCDLLERVFSHRIKMVMVLDKICVFNVTISEWSLFLNSLRLGTERQYISIPLLILSNFDNDYKSTFKRAFLQLEPDMIWDFLKEDLKLWHYLQADSLKRIRPGYKPFYFLISLKCVCVKSHFFFFLSYSEHWVNSTISKDIAKALLRRKENFP